MTAQKPKRLQVGESIILEPFEPSSAHTLIDHCAAGLIHLGRNEDCGLVDGRISREHATIRFDGGCWVLRDSGSTNGTIVDGAMVLDCEHELRDGSTIVLALAVAYRVWLC